MCGRRWERGVVVGGGGVETVVGGEKMSEVRAWPRSGRVGGVDEAEPSVFAAAWESAAFRSQAWVVVSVSRPRSWRSWNVLSSNSTAVSNRYGRSACSWWFAMSCHAVLAKNGEIQIGKD